MKQKTMLRKLMFLLLVMLFLPLFSSLIAAVTTEEISQTLDALYFEIDSLVKEENLDLNSYYLNVDWLNVQQLQQQSLLPQITLNSPSSNLYINTTAVKFNFTLIRNTTQTTSCSLTLDNTVIAEYINVTQEQNINETIVTEGLHTWYVHCQDDLGNTTSSTSIFNIDTKSPIITLNTVDNYMSNASTVNLNFTVEDDFDSALDCGITVDGITHTVTAINNSLTNKQINSIITGSHLWNVSCEDNAKNTIVSETRSFSFNPGQLLIQLNSPNNGVEVTTNQITFNFKIISSFASALCNLTVNGITNESDINSVTGTETTVSIGLFNEGSHSWRFDCSQGAATNISETRTFIVPSQAASVATDKSSYKIGETGNFTINAPFNSEVYTAITTPVGITYIYSYANDTSYPVSDFLPYTNKSGTYTIDVTFYAPTYTKTTSVMFNVENTLAGDISPKDAIVGTGDKVNFTTSITGGLRSLKYAWTINGQQFKDSSVNYTFQNPGVYTVKLNASDDENNQKLITTEIIVKNRYNVEISVTNTTDHLENAIVDLDGIVKSSDSNGLVEYDLYDGMYDLKVTKPGYHKYTSTLNITSAVVHIVDLSQKGFPVIVLNSPINGNTISEGSVKLNFNVVYNASVDCNIYLNYDQNWWSLEGNISNIRTNTEQTLQLSNVTKGAYNWQVDCIDKSGNRAVSESSFTVDSYIPKVAKANLTDDFVAKLLTKVENLINNIDTLSPDQRLVADELGYSTALDEAKKQLTRIRRDINGIEFIRDEELREERRADVFTRYYAVIDKTPINFSVLNKYDFVKYPDKESIKDVTNQYLDNKNIQASSKQLDSFVIEVENAQGSLTVTTRTKTVTVEYLSGESKVITLVSKDLKTTNNLKDVIILEMIPKDIISSASEITFLTPHTILEDDPLIAFDIIAPGKIAYSIPKELDLKETEKIITLQISKYIELQSRKPSGITGFVTRGVDAATGNYTALGVIVFIMLLVVVVANYFHLMPAVTQRLTKDKELSEIRKLILKTQILLKERNHEKASHIYKELRLQYSKISQGKKNKVHNDVNKLYAEMLVIQIDDLVKEAFLCIKNKIVKKAMHNYSLIQKHYSALPKEHKLKVSKASVELHKQLSKK